MSFATEQRLDGSVNLIDRHKLEALVLVIEARFQHAAPQDTSCERSHDPLRTAPIFPDNRAR